MYFSVPTEDGAPRAVQAERTADQARPDQPAETVPAATPPASPPRPEHSSVQKTLLAMADYDKPAEPVALAAPPPQPVTPAPRDPPPTAAAPSAAPPTAPVHVRRLDAKDFKLGAILQSGNAAHAIVNDQLVSVGDEVDDATVVEIGKYHVVLRRDGQRVKLGL